MSLIDPNKPVPPPQRQHFIVAFGMGPVTCIVDRYPSFVYATVYREAEGMQNFETPLPEEAEDYLGAIWAIRLCLDLGITGPPVFLREGSVDVRTFAAAINSAGAILVAQYLEPGPGPETGSGPPGPSDLLH